VAGAIAWSRSLFSRVRKTMSRFQADADEEMKSEAGPGPFTMALPYHTPPFSLT